MIAKRVREVDAVHWDPYPWWTRFYRIAYLNPNMRESVWYPVGLHLLVRWVNRLWNLSYHYTPSKWESQLKEAELKGFSAGMRVEREHQKRQRGARVEH